MLVESFIQMIFTFFLFKEIAVERKEFFKIRSIGSSKKRDHSPPLSTIEHPGYRNNAYM